MDRVRSEFALLQKPLHHDLNAFERCWRWFVVLPCWCFVLLHLVRMGILVERGVITFSEAESLIFEKNSPFLGVDVAAGAAARDVLDVAIVRMLILDVEATFDAAHLVAARFIVPAATLCTMML